jgi:5S rRNA maturation endonuclease (ribonuclease M5)
MPTGASLAQVDDFEEFEKAYDIFEELTDNHKKELDELKKKISESTNPLIICEGKTDILHIKKAKEKLNITDDVEFYDVPEDWGDSKLKILLEQLAKIPQARKIIGIFDRDVEKIVKEIEQEENTIKDYGNNVFAFCLPLPESRKDYTNISIEFYYSDDELKTAKEEKSLYFDNEVEFRQSASNKGDRHLVKLNAKKEDEENTKKVFDENIGELDWIHSKSVFANLVATDVDFINNFDFKNFSLIFDQLKKIITPENNQNSVTKESKE